MSAFQVKAAEANRWWRQNASSGALLNKLMLLFVAGPIALVFENAYTLSFFVFALMVPYGFLMRYLAVRAVHKHLTIHPEAVQDFETEGIVVTASSSVS